MSKDFIPFIAHSEITDLIYVYYTPTKKVDVTEQVIEAMEQTGRLKKRQEPSIPESYIEEQIQWLNSMDNEFSKLAAMQIGVLLKQWRERCMSSNCEHREDRAYADFKPPRYCSNCGSKNGV